MFTSLTASPQPLHPQRLLMHPLYPSTAVQLYTSPYQPPSNCSTSFPPSPPQARSKEWEADTVHMPHRTRPYPRDLTRDCVDVMNPNPSNAHSRTRPCKPPPVGAAIKTLQPLISRCPLPAAFLTRIVNWTSSPSAVPRPSCPTCAGIPARENKFHHI